MAAHILSNMTQKEKIVFLDKKEVIIKKSPTEKKADPIKEQKIEAKIEEKAIPPKESPSQNQNNTSSKEARLPLAELAKDDLVGLSEDGQEILKMSKSIKAEQKEESSEKDQKRDVLRRSNSSALEEQLFHEKINSRATTSPVHPDYTQHLAQEPMAKIYHEMTSLYELAGEKGYLNPDEQRRVQYLASAVEQKVQDAEEHRYTMTEEAAAVLGITRQIGSKLRSLYKGNSADYRPTYS